jgi:hypothetical protein
MVGLSDRIEELESENARLRGLIYAALNARVEYDIEWQVDARAALAELKGETDE